ncbi:YrhK family protein [Agilicoccus flavus]|uniref:YrhK family protein n=1 Tax=Agilicoccus flavus TaxID=2775968 RepID=UPI001CF703FE|nr:YrhK family protein [Agilicoccus flavus]
MNAAPDLTIRIGRDELMIRQRYETLSIVNDICSGLLFLVGSVLFFSPATMYGATWMFVIGSLLMLFRPVIRLTRRVHLRRRHGGDLAPAHESSMDF